MAKVNRVQDEFRRMIRDIPRNRLPKGTCWTIQDGIPNQDAPVRTRGGWVHYSDNITATIAASSYVTAGIYADQLATPRLVGVDEDGRLFRVAVDGTGDVTDIGAAVVTLQNPVQLGARIAIPASDGTSVPKTWDGTTLANLGGSPPAGKFMGVWKALGLLAASTAQPQRLYFSTTDNSLQAWDTTNAFWDFSYPIVGLAPLRNAILVFHDDFTSRLRGSTPPPGGDLIADDPLFNIGCADARSIAFWNEQVVWANTDGLYISDGIVPNDLTRLAGMGKYWQELLGAYTPATWTITGGVIRNSYVVCVMDGATFKGAAIVELGNPNAWVNVTNLDARAMWRTTALTGAELMFFGRRGGAYIGEMSTMWTPSATYKNDGDGDPVQMVMETPFYEFGTGLDLVRDVYVTYDLEDAATDDPTITVGFVTDPSETAYTNVESASATNVTYTFGETTSRTRRRGTVNRTGLGFALKVLQTNASADCRIWSVEADGYGLEEDRLG
jgi:hypothetical protein